MCIYERAAFPVGSLKLSSHHIRRKQNQCAQNQRFLISAGTTPMSLGHLLMVYMHTLMLWCIAAPGWIVSSLSSTIFHAPVFAASSYSVLWTGLMTHAVQPFHCTRFIPSKSNISPRRTGPFQTGKSVRINRLSLVLQSRLSDKRLCAGEWWCWDVCVCVCVCVCRSSGESPSCCCCS